MHRTKVQPKKFYIWGLEGTTVGTVFYFLILFLNDGTPLILEQLSYFSSFLFAILLIFIISIFFGLIYSFLMIQFTSRNFITTDDLWKTIILGSIFGLIVYFTKVLALFSWLIDLSISTAIIQLINLEKETWLELLGNLIFGIVTAVIVRTAYEKYIGGFKLNTLPNK
ncbi:MAG: hypothetical protein ACXAB2_02000 [Candidatus Hodarchaeales archaeon]|jgi:hypothetical protein